jgi:penicillin-binding protein-related factor A (putative recombinase)
LERYKQTAVINYLRHLPYCRVTNIHGSSYQEKGISDLLVCYKGQHIALELKDEADVEPAQLAYLRSVRRAQGIAEIIYDISTVKDIIHCIDSGQKWRPLSDLSPRRK